jgi:3-hydroxyisobutyrate dehydrogenase
MNLFFIGVGNMGLPMAANLLRAGHRLWVHDIDRTKASTLEANGALWVEDIAQGVKQAELILASLPGPAQVEAVMLGQSGVFEQLKPGQVVIDTSTSSVELARLLDEKARSKGAHYLESPITNAVDGAAAGRLSIFIGGEKSVYESCLPIYQTLGNKLFHVGPAGNAATVKLLTNLLWFVGAATIGEALMLGAKAGVELNTVWEALKHSAGDSWVVQHDVPSIFAGHYDPSFSLALCCKDLHLINQIASEQGYELTMGRFVQQVFQKAMDTYGPDAAELHVVKLLEERVGTFLRPPHGQSQEG